MHAYPSCIAALALQQGMICERLQTSIEKHTRQRNVQVPDKRPYTIRLLQVTHKIPRSYPTTKMAESLLIFGGIAATSQVAGQILVASRSIRSFYHAIKDAPTLLKKQLWHLDQVTTIVKLIMTNENLQTDAVESILRSCLSSVEELHQLLEKSRIGRRKKNNVIVRVEKVMAALRGERVEGVFQRLERDMGLLAVCIQEIDT